MGDVAGWKDFVSSQITQAHQDEARRVVGTTTTAAAAAPGASPSDDAAVLAGLSEDLGFEEIELEPVEVGKDVKASELHGDFKLVISDVARDGGGDAEEKAKAKRLLDSIPLAELATEISNCLPGRQQIAALFFDDNGGLMVRWSVSSVGTLHEMRDMILQGKLDGRLAEAMAAKQASADVDGISRIRVDLSSFAEQYERCILLLDKLTPHQQQKLEECEGEDNIHVQAPAGAGKTFVALHRMLQMLKNEYGSVLFVARNPALCLFVAKWVNERLSKENSGTQTRKKMLARIHLLCHPLKQGPRSISIAGGRVKFRAISDGTAQTSYSLLVVDEVRLSREIIFF